MGRREVAASALALLAAPSLLLVQTLVVQHAWMVLVVAITAATAGLFLWQLVFMRTWPLQAEVHRVCIRGDALGLASAVGIASFYAAHLIGPHTRLPPAVLDRVLLCLWNWVLLSSLASSAHVSLAFWRRGVALAWAPFAVQLGLLPWFTPDRCPFSVQPHWPSYWHHAGAAFSLALSCVCCFCPHVLITLALEPHRGHTPPASVHYTYYERLPQAAATLSISYLLMIWIWMGFGAEPFWHGLYHILWSYLRPSYVLLFAVYGLKDSSYFPAVNMVACGLGFVFFSVFAPLTQTLNSFECGSTFEQDTGWSHVGEYSHAVEATCFYLSMCLFHVHGLCSGVWQDENPRVCGRLQLSVLIAMLVVASFAVVATSLSLRFSKGGEKVNFITNYPAALEKVQFWALEWMWWNYLMPYGTVVFATSYTLVSSQVRRHLLTVEVAQELQPLVVETSKVEPLAGSVAA